MKFLALYLIVLFFAIFIVDYVLSEANKDAQSGHIPLEYQIAFGAFVFVSGLYHAHNSFRIGGIIPPATGAFYLICGMLCIGIGLGLVLSGLYP